MSKKRIEYHRYGSKIVNDVFDAHCFAFSVGTNCCFNNKK